MTGCADPACASRWTARAGSSTTSFVERLWRSLKYECVYLHAWETGSEARTGVGKWIEFYNRKRSPFRPWRQTPSRGLLAEKKTKPNPVSRSKE
ncbi:integrase core domain-containing protein [Jhaorihella thermophila]